MKKILLAAIVVLLAHSGLAQQPLKILQTDIDETAGTLLIMGTSFGMPNPEVTLAGQTLTILSYTKDTNPATPKADSEALAELPSPIQPGTYLLRVADSLNPASEFDEFNIQIGAAASTQLVIRSVEPSSDPQPCTADCAGTLLISGLNFGAEPIFSGEVSLFLPGQGELPLPVLAFDPITQEILTELPIEFSDVSGSLLLGVSTGDGQGDFDVFDVTLEGDGDSSNELQVLSLNGTNVTLSKGGQSVSINDPDSDPQNEIQQLSLNATELSLSNGGGTVSIDDRDPDPGNELQDLTQSGNVLTLSGNGGSVTVNANDADADPANEIQTLTASGSTLSLSGQSNTVEMNPDIITRGDLNNTAVGEAALGNAISGERNTAVGFLAMRNTDTGDRNTAVGHQTLADNTIGHGNVAVGDSSLLRNTIGSSNVALGWNSLAHNTGGTANIGIGSGTLFRTEIGRDNVAIGHQALGSNQFGNANIGLGVRSLFNLNTGGANVAFGVNSGFSLTDGSDNILISNPGRPVENQTIRIGSSQQRAFMAGIHSTDVGSSALPVVINADGQLGTAAVGAVPALAGQVCPIGTRLAGFDEQGEPICRAGTTLIEFDEVPENTPLEGVNINGATFSMPNKTGGGPFQTYDFGFGIGMNGPTIPVHIIFDEPSSSIVFDYTANAIISAVTLDLFDDDNIQIGSTTVELVPTPGSLGGVGFVEFTADVPFRTAIVTTTPTTTGVGFLLDNLRFGYQPVGGDPDPTNEFQTLTLDGADLSLSRNGGTVSINDADPDPVNETNQSLDFDGTTLSISDASGTLARDLSSLRDDADADPANEKVSAFALDPDGTTLRLTEAGGESNSRLECFPAASRRRLGSDQRTADPLPSGKQLRLEWWGQSSSPSIQTSSSQEPPTTALELGSTH